MQNAAFMGMEEFKEAEVNGKIYDTRVYCCCTSGHVLYFDSDDEAIKWFLDYAVSLPENLDSFESAELRKRVGGRGQSIVIAELRKA